MGKDKEGGRLKQVPRDDQLLLEYTNPYIPKQNSALIQCWIASLGHVTTVCFYQGGQAKIRHETALGK